VKSISTHQLIGIAMDRTVRVIVINCLIDLWDRYDHRQNTIRSSLKGQNIGRSKMNEG
jgi:hypothetical protein